MAATQPSAHAVLLVDAVIRTGRDLAQSAHRSSAPVPMIRAAIAKQDAATEALFDYIASLEQRLGVAA